MTTPEIASALTQRIQFNTFGGNPVCSAAGLAVLKVLDKEKRQAHCANIGAHLLGRLRSLQQRHDRNCSKLVLEFLIAVFTCLVADTISELPVGCLGSIP